MTDNNGKLFERITRVMMAVKALEPDKRHQQGYQYISADKILSRLGEAMVGEGLAIIPAATGHTTTTHKYESRGQTKTMYQADVDMVMTVCDQDGNQFAAPWRGSGLDYASPDKAFYKALTSGHKYYVMKLFMVGVGNEDGEHETPPQRQDPQRQPKQPPDPQPARSSSGNPTGARVAGEAKAALVATAQDGSNNPASDKQLKYARASLSKLVDGDADKAKMILFHVYGIDSSSELTGGQTSALIDWVGATNDNGYTPTDAAQIEAHRLIGAFRKAQEPLFPADQPAGAYAE